MSNCSPKDQVIWICAFKFFFLSDKPKLNFMKQSLKSFLWSEMNKISTQFFNNEKKNYTFVYF